MSVFFFHYHPAPWHAHTVAQVGLIGLEMFGFKIPVRDVNKALSTISLSASLGIRRALALMLQADPLKRHLYISCPTIQLYTVSVNYLIFVPLDIEAPH